MPGALKPLGAGFLPLISAVARGLGASLDDTPPVERRWLDLIAIWNAKIDLTAARHTDELVDLMLADAFVLSRYQPPGCHVVDVGSGAGGPGLALSLARSDLDRHFGRAAPETRGVSADGSRPAGDGRYASKLRVVREKGEDAASRGESFDVAMSRATLAPAEWLALGARLVGASGSVWVLLARESAPQLDGWKATLDEAYRWPLTGAERRVVRYERSP